MQLERREAIELVLSSRASLLLQVATRLSSFDLKTTEPEKSYKESGALNLKHRERRSCDERNAKTTVSRKDAKIKKRLKVIRRSSFRLVS